VLQVNMQIVLGYQGAEELAEQWAFGGDGIDFRKEPEAAARCTAAFAAMELKSHIARTLPGAEIAIVSKRRGVDFFIELGIANAAGCSAAFTLEPKVGGLAILGESRKGLLYGAYEFLRINGWRWHAPGDDGEIAPILADKLTVPDAKKVYGPSMPLGRGFDFEYLSMDCRELYLWMARNRMDVASFRPLTGQFCRKLGMEFKNGGHIFEKILEPDRRMSSGKTLWEVHADWFGLPPGGVRQKELAQSTQFCVSNKALTAFLGEEILKRMSGRWQEADRLDIFGFDTWGNGCCCDACKGLGNGSDRMLHFLSQLRGTIDLAVRSGRVDHNVRLVMGVYEGTSTLDAPINPVPENLAASGDYCVVYPILRCYAHDFSDDGCPRNFTHAESLRGWLSCSPRIPIMVGEYYNVSKFEDLPLLFTDRIAHDIPYYRGLGVSGMTYMHIPTVNWGMRTLTQVLYAQMLWDEQTDVPAFIQEYFELRYGPHAAAMHEAYRLTEEAWAFSASWRAWGAESVLSQLQKWDGRKPDAPLGVDRHFSTPEGAIASGCRSIKLLNKAMKCLNGAIAAFRQAPGEEPGAGMAAAVNPVAQRLLAGYGSYEKRLSEDRRLLRYGQDTMKLMTGLAEYHNALYLGDDAAAGKLWHAIDALADSMDQYYLPIGYEWPGPGLESKDALTRTQTGELIGRIRRGLPHSCN
jgi:hypothetical protein